MTARLIHNVTTNRTWKMSGATDDDVRVVLEQTLLKAEESFVYRIPPMKTSGGHRAEDWNLATPLATCSVEVLRRDSDLLIKLMGERPKEGGPKGATETYLFAQCHITAGADSTKPLNMPYWVESVVDSSRYFVLRISDERTGRQAHVGMGFRERIDATNFRMSLQEYENVLKKEQKVSALSHETAKPEDTNSTDNNDESPPSPPMPEISKLTLKEGEKIHVSLKGVTPTKSSSSRQSSSSSSSSSLGKGGLLLKKPPPPATAAAATTDDNGDEPRPLDSIPDALKAKADINRSRPKDDGDGVEYALNNSIREDDVSTAAVGETDGDDDDDDDEWGDFEDGTSQQPVVNYDI